MHLPLWKGRTWQDANIKLATLSQAVTLGTILPVVGGCSLAERKLFVPKSAEKKKAELAIFLSNLSQYFWNKKTSLLRFQVFFVLFCLLVLLPLWASQDRHIASSTRNKYKKTAFTLFRLFLHRCHFFVNSECLYIAQFTVLLNSSIWIWVFKQNIRASNGQQCSQKAN